MNAQERYEYWLNSPDVDEGTKAELKAIAGDPVEIEDRWRSRIGSIRSCPSARRAFGACWAPATTG